MADEETTDAAEQTSEQPNRAQRAMLLMRSIDALAEGANDAMEQARRSRNLAAALTLRGMEYQKQLEALHREVQEQQAPEQPSTETDKE